MSTEFYEVLKDQDEKILGDIRRLVEKESPTLDKKLVDQCGEEIQILFRNYFNKEPQIFKREKYGNHLKYIFGEGEEQILISGHFDTVWPEGHLSFQVQGDKAYGPGTIDMKGGLVIAIWALKTLLDSGVCLHKKVVFLCNSDHEGVASPDSREIIEEESQKSVAVLIPEAAEEGTNALKVERKGILRYTLKVKGKSAHSGNNPEDGVNAITALAELVGEIDSWTDYSVGTTVNVGKIEGGTGVNVVPGEAQASVDIRVKTMTEAIRLKQMMNNLKVKKDGATLQIQGGIVRPTLEQTPRSKELYEIVKSYGDKIGYEVKEARVGGGSDGSFAAALGIPTLDGLGAAGGGPHAEHEHILINHLGYRTALLAHLIYELTRK
jgi:glutamate carboxypeptidase